MLQARWEKSEENSQADLDFLARNAFAVMDFAAGAKIASF